MRHINLDVSKHQETGTDYSVIIYFNSNLIASVLLVNKQCTQVGRVGKWVVSMLTLIIDD